MHKHSKRRSLSSWQQRRRQKENRRPSDDGAAGETPPCLRGGSPLLCDEDPGVHVASSFAESCCRSLMSLPSGSGTLLNALHPGTQCMATAARPVVEGRGAGTGNGRISTAVGAGPSRWTIAVEVDADAGMFEEIPRGGVIVAGPPSSAMNLSTHW